MKPYGLRKGDGIPEPKGNGGNRRIRGLNKFDRRLDEGGPKGKHKEAKLHKERMLVHRQGRADERKQIDQAKKGFGEDD